MLAMYRRRTLLTCILAVIGLLLGLPGQTLASEREVVIFGNHHTAVGTATLTVLSDGTLLVSNLGIDGNDGVAIDVTGLIEPGEEFLVETPTFEEPLEAPAGAYVNVNAVGVVNGIQGQLVSTQRTVVQGSFSEDNTQEPSAELEGTFDLSPLAPAGIDLEAFKDGMFQESLALPSATATGGYSLASDLTWSISLPPDIDLCGSFSFATVGTDAASISMEGPGMLQYLLKAHQPANILDGYTRLEITAGGGLNQFIISSERVEPTPVAPAPQALKPE